MSSRSMTTTTTHHTGGMTTVLVVDDEEHIRALLYSTFRFAGYDVLEASDGASALNVVGGGEVDVLVLDVGLPDLDGFELVRMLRSRDVRTPVLMLTARLEVEDRVQGLRLGADDYVTKPFSVAEVVARVEALLRRSAPAAEPEPDLLRLDDLVVDLATLRITRGGRPVDLSPTELRLLVYLLENSGRVLSKTQILQHVWGYDFGGDTNVVERFVSNLRRKIDDGAGTPLLHTVRGFGYSARVLPR
jgi:two-component system OmpR family response regulator